ncbi:MAG TPA: HDIG domain-containing protein, partial [Nitrospirae bacterium]|nr:HDIG domain-containing protein [Nitrospirota bacterium]
SGLGVAAIVSITLPVLEYIFKITTDISLLELLDLNQPLMKNLMITAPGTYHHSIIVGNLVEASAEAVGVNPLLARVSAYYHDIGKIKMPEYFVENQAGSVSKHDKLSPHMSSMILISHVKEGTELGKQYNLPQIINDIIEQHHGTNLITYFYQKAKNDMGENPSEEEYRYPGPKPQSRVAALVMLADAVEAASRVLKDPTPSRIEALVDKIINHVFIDGQLDDCELTLKDLSLIKKHFIYILTGIFHRRIDYPGFDFNSDSKPKLSEGTDNGSRDKRSAETGKNRHEKTPERY